MKSKVTQTNQLTFNQKQPPTKELKSIIENASNFLVVSHIDPDGDALGTQLAFAAYLKDIGKSVLLVRESDIPLKYQFLPNVNEIPHFDSLDENYNFDVAIVLECPDFRRIGKPYNWISDETLLVNIDHHRDNRLESQFNWLNIEASSVGEMVYEYFESVNYRVSKESAICLFTAILTDTGRFRYNSTSQRTLEIAGKLVGTGIDTQKICDEIYYNMKPSTVKLIGKVLNQMEFYLDGKLCLLTLTKEMLKESGADSSESDGLIDYTLYNTGVEVGVLIKEFEENKTKVSMRSKDKINVAEIANSFGGGGHFNASGCLIDKKLQETKDTLIDIFKEKL